MFKRFNLIDSGAYSNVYLCIYNKMIKIVKTVEIDSEDCLLLKSIIRETFLLQNMNNPYIMNTNIIFFEKSRKPNTKTIIKTINYVMDIYSHNLHIQMENWRSTKLNINLLKKITIQILHGVNYLHKNNIIHRDLKPENILVNGDFDIKITDFGISKLDYLTSESKPITNSDYVQTLWYRAPEVFLLECCNKKSDMWSIGCIFYELLSCRKNVLFAYKSSAEVLFAMFKTFNILYPPVNILKHYKIDEKLIPIDIEKFNIDYRLNKYSKIKDELYFDLIKKLITYDPNERYLTEDCLNHNFYNSKKISIKDQITLPIDIKYIDNTNFRGNTNDKKYLKECLYNLVKLKPY